MSNDFWSDLRNVKISFQCKDGLKKVACLFAGLGHLQPLLLATTNSHYLLDRFCMERCCSSDYVSRIVTSLIFMEILSIILVRIAILIVFKFWEKPGWSGTQNLNNWNQWEELVRGIVGSIILSFIQLGYIQILYAFTTGGKKGHMEWFYSSLLIQHFLNSLIAGSIGFWEVGLALWYLVTLPMAPIVIFFYQLMIHSWIRNNGSRDVEYIVVEYQIVLATALSMLATIFWIYGYVIPTTPVELNIPDGLSNANSNITGEPVKLTIVTINSGQPGVTLNTSSPSNINVHSATLTLTLNTSKLNISNPSEDIKVYSVTQTLEATLSGGAVSGGAIPLVYKETLVPKPGHPTGTLKLVYENSDVTKQNIQTSSTSSITLTIPDITLYLQTLESKSATIETTQAATAVTIQSINLALTGTVGTGGAETVKYQSDGSVTVQTAQVDGKTFTPHNGCYIYSVKDSSVSTKDGNNNDAKPDIWASGGKHVHATYYYYKNGENTPTKALLCLSVYAGEKFNTNIFYGRENTAGKDKPWKNIPNEDEFIKNLKTLSGGSLDLTDEKFKVTTQYNRYFDNVLWDNWNPSTPTATWAPLVMQGLSVGAVGSIFPNLIPKTLTCPRTTRTLSVINMFLVTIPHIFNVMLGDMDLLSRIGAGDDWLGSGWHYSLLLYLIYALAILFAIFNIHYPEWRLSSFLRNNTWLVFLMILFTDVLNETFNAISRAGICSQKAAGGEGKKNHPCLHNKIACLMNLTYIPFWLTTTPMMKSYVSSLDPFLCDKDRDHWPTARYGRLRSFGYWCKCGLRGLYNSPRKLVTRDMRKALTRKDPKVYFLVTHDLPPED